MSTLPLPPLPEGSTREQLLGQYTYLFQMAQQLNLALEQLESHTAVSAPAAGLAAAAPGDWADQYHTLRSLIVKTADTVQARLDRLTATLTGEYVAQSDFGTYVQQLSAFLEANPEAVSQYYRFAADLQADTAAVTAAFDRYRTETEGYIRTGIVCWEGDLPVYGVAVGQHLTTTEVDGEPVVDQTHFRALFTAEKLSFWQDATEVAYISNNRLYIRDITVLGSVTLGSWRLDSSDGLAFQWMGG